MRVAIPVCLLFGLAAFASAQNARRPSFEVASVKLNLTGSGNTNTNGDPGLLVITNLTLDRLIQMAFRVSPAEISGPDWLNSGRVDIAAKYPAGSTHEDRGGMMEIENQTGIDGNFSFQLKWSREQPKATDPDAPPTLFEVLPEVLGLRLQSQKVSVRMVVVDHIERTPTEN